MNETKIALIVDDDEAISASIQKRIQENLGHQCDTANSIFQAKSLMRNTDYDYIILDMELPYQFGQMPDVGVGITFLGQLRDRYTSEELPIIVITGRLPDHETLPSDAIYEGATDFITKPLLWMGDHTLEDSIMKFVMHNKATVKQVFKSTLQSPRTRLMAATLTSSVQTRRLLSRNVFIKNLSVFSVLSLRFHGVEPSNY